MIEALSDWEKDSSDDEKSGSSDDDGEDAEADHTKKKFANQVLKRDKKNRVGVRMPRSLAVLKVLGKFEIVGEGTETISRSAMMLLAAESDERDAKRSAVKREDAMHVDLVCGRDQNCKRHFRAAFNGSYSKPLWTCTLSEQHTCRGNAEAQERYKSSAYSVDQLAEIVMPMVAADSNVSHKSLTAKVTEFVNLKPSRSIISRARQKALDVKYGNADEEMKNLPAYCAALKECGHRTEIQWVRAAAIILIYVSNLEAQHDSEMKKLRKSQRKKFDRVSVTQNISQLVEKYAPETKFFISVSFMPGPIVLGIESFRPNDQSDATHMKTRIAGNIFSSYLMDANNHSALLAHSVTFLNESEQSHNIINRFKLQHLGDRYDREDGFITTDGDKGGIKSCKKIFSKRTSFLCSRHRGERFSMVSPSDANLYLQAVKSISLREIEECKQEMSEKAKKMISQVSDSQQFMLSANGTFGTSSTNTVESMNNANMAARKLHYAGIISPLSISVLKHLHTSQSSWFSLMSLHSKPYTLNLSL
jgi:hypothetical protein